MATGKLPLASIDDCLTALTTAFSTTSKLHLFTNQPVIGPGTAVADFAQATFTGSAAKTVATWSDPYNAPGGGERVVVGASQTFIATAVADSETIRGWYLTDMAGTGYEGAAYLDTPVGIDEVGDGLTVVPTFGQTSLCE